MTAQDLLPLCQAHNETASLENLENGLRLALQSSLRPSLYPPLHSALRLRLAGFGVLMGAAGFLGWSLHPDAIAKLLT